MKISVTLVCLLGFFACGAYGRGVRHDHPHEHDAESRPGTHVDHLIEDLFHHYHRSVRPCVNKDCSDAIRVNFGMTFLNFDLKLEEKELRSHGWAKMMWSDPRLKWNPEQYGGISEIRVPQNKLWIPDIYLFNRFEHVDQEAFWDQHVLAVVYSSGDVLFIPPTVLSSFCAFNKNKTSDTEWASQQECPLKFGSWTYSKNSIDLQLYEGEACDLNDYMGTVQRDWAVKSCNSQVVDATYPCCEEIYPRLDMIVNFNKGTRQDELNNLLNVSVKDKHQEASEKKDEDTFWF